MSRAAQPSAFSEVSSSGGALGCVVVRVCVLPDLTALLDVLLFLRRGLVTLAGIARRELNVLLRRDAGLQLAAALELSVELRPKE